MRLNSSNQHAHGSAPMVDDTELVPLSRQNVALASDNQLPALCILLLYERIGLRHRESPFLESG